MRPKLPVTERLVGYLRQVDQSRVYSNFGPLVRAVEARLSDHYGLGAGTITTVANATLGLTLTLSAVGAKHGTLCAMPAWTFIASAHAAVNAGLVPYFIDVDPKTWSLDASAVAEQIAHAPAPVGAVMPFGPFGAPIDVSAWDAFRDQTGLPVVIDAAAGFDSLVPGDTPAVVSLHATKILGTGEGGLVISRDASIVHRVRRASNFGLDPNRQATIGATNAKMSEYHAALGHAALDDWDEDRAAWMAAARAYAGAFAASNRLQLQDGFGEKWVSSTCVLHAPDSSVARIETALSDAGIETRRWWGKGAQTHAVTERFPRARLPATQALADSTIAVPFYRDMDHAEIQRVGEIVLSA